MRNVFEEREQNELKPYAVKSRESLGRRYPEPPSPTRTCFQRDRDRIIHAKSFRRLKHKTQVFVAMDESDHFRTRLTHTIEVSHISRHMARLLFVNEDLSETIALAHDLGHTPFGHSGEAELNELMADFGGFEHNRQSLRIVDELETKYPLFAGLNLSYEVREGLMKHSSPWDTPDPEIKNPSLEAQIVNLGDEIAYNNHDLDDGIAANILELTALEKGVTLWHDARQTVSAQYANLNLDQQLYLINSHLISGLIEDVFHQTHRNLSRLDITSLDQIRLNPDPIVSFSPEMKAKNNELRQFLNTYFYQHHTVYQMMKNGREMINRLFQAYTHDPTLLPIKFQSRINADTTKERVICDYIAGMTDHFAQREYLKLA